MASFDCLVDTSPMAASVNDVSNHVSMTTAAVAAMETAVILAEKKSAEDICRNIDRGFFCLINSQISLKKAQRLSELKAKFNQLYQMSKSLTDKQIRMENDVARLKREYFRIFDGIDKVLEHRVFELDSHAAGIAAERKELITGRLCKTVPEAMCAEYESENLASMVCTARLKSKISKAVTYVAGNISESNEYAGQLDDILASEPTESAVQEYVPVLVVEEKSLNNKDVTISRIYPPEYVDKITGQAIQNTIEENGGISFSENSDMEKTEIRKAFQVISDKANLDSRITEQIFKMFLGDGY